MELIVYVIMLAFFFELMDSSAGMGFGTGLTPLLLLIGYEPLQVVPILLISESVTGFIAGIFHHEFENVDFSFSKKMSTEMRITLVITAFGCFAIFFSVILTYFALKLPTDIVKTYVAILVLAMGLIAILRFKEKTPVYRPKLLFGFAALAGFNKGIGGGGYGPLVMLGQLLSGIYEKSAAAIVSLAEGMVSILGFASFLLISAYGISIDYVLLPSILTGGFIAAIIAPYMVRILPNTFWKIVIPIYALFIGAFTLTEVYL